jgi:signal transduction histidine kinase
VRDNGIGIAPKDFARVFVMFQRLHTESEFPGSGIGLAVCRRIVARHGGRIWVESRPGQGATFHLTLAKGLPLGADPVREESAWPSRER